MTYLQKKKQALLNYVQSGGGRLPSEYQEVEWIGSDGNQYINTDFIPNTDTKAEIRCSYNATSSGSHSMMGAISSGSTSYFGIPAQVGASIVFYYNGFTYLGNNVLSANDIITASLETTSTNATAYALNENTQWTNTLVKNGTLTLTKPLYLFCYNNNGNGVGEKSNGKIYYFKATKDGQQARDMIPCYRKADQVIGMYDTISQTFFTNSGSGTFTKGNDVN